MKLQLAKQLIECVERRAAETGLHAVIAVCNAYGNPVAVHVMDDAFLVSYDVATKKAYTSVAVKTPEGTNDYYYDRMLVREDGNFLSDLVSLIEREAQGRK